MSILLQFLLWAAYVFFGYIFARIIIWVAIEYFSINDKFLFPIVLGLISLWPLMIVLVLIVGPFLAALAFLERLSK